MIAPHRAARTDDAVLIEIAGLRAEVASLRQVIERLVQPTSPPRQWLSTRQAAEMCGRSEQCVRGYCRSYHIGTRVGHHWQVDRTHLRTLLADRYGEDRLPVRLRAA